MEKLGLSKFEDKKISFLSKIQGGGSIETSWVGSHKCGRDKLDDTNGDGEPSCGETVDFLDGTSGTVVC